MADGHRMVCVHSNRPGVCQAPGCEQRCIVCGRSWDDHDERMAKGVNDPDCIQCGKGNHGECVFTFGGAGPCGCADRGHLRHKPPSKPKKQSRNARWSDAAQRAVDALEELNSLKEEYQEWYDNTPENLQQSPMGEKLEAICNIDIESALDIANEAVGADLPLGFGRD